MKFQVYAFLICVSLCVKFLKIEYPHSDPPKSTMYLPDTIRVAALSALILAGPLAVKALKELQEISNHYLMEEFESVFQPVFLNCKLLLM